MKKLLYIILFLIICGLLWFFVFHKKDNIDISVSYQITGNLENLGCLSVYVNDASLNNEYSFDNGIHWQKSKYGAIYGNTKVLVRNIDKDIIYTKEINNNYFVTNAPIIKLDFDKKVGNKTSSELLKGVTATLKGKDILAKVNLIIIEEKEGETLATYLVENDNKKCYIVRSIDVDTSLIPKPMDKWEWPTDRPYQITRGYNSGKHNGVDIYGPKRGSKVYAAKDGEVVDINSNASSGYYVTLKHANGYYTRYAHMQNVNGNDKLGSKSSASKYIKNGDIVKAKQVIGEVGGSGNSTAVHLHYEIWNGKPFLSQALDPLKYY